MNQTHWKKGDSVYFKGMPYEVISFILYDEVTENIVTMGIGSLEEAVHMRSLFPSEQFSIQVKLMNLAFDCVVLPLNKFIAYNWSKPGLIAGNAFGNGRIIKFVLETTLGFFTEYELSSIANLEFYLQDYRPVLKVLIEVGKRVELVPYRERQVESIEEPKKGVWSDLDLV